MLDQIKDVNEAGLYKLSTVFEFPEFVKTASHATAEDVRDIATGMFAWPGERMFPMHTKADTWLSAAYFRKFASEIPEHARGPIGAALEQAADFWQISLPEQMQAKEAAVAEPAFSVEYRFKDQVYHVAECENADQLYKVAADAMIPGKYPYAMRRDLARQVLAYEQELPEHFEADLYKTAGYGTGNLGTARHAVHQRLVGVRDHWNHLADGLQELDALLVKTAGEQPLVSTGMLDKTAAMLDAVDRFAGFDKRYNEHIRPPEQQLFEITINDVDSFNKQAMQLSSGHVVSEREVLASNARAFLSNYGYDKTASAEDLRKTIMGLDPRRATQLYEHIQRTAYAQ